jgi:hypothetical protein
MRGHRQRPRIRPWGWHFMTRGIVAFTTGLVLAASLGLAGSQAQQSNPVSVIATLFEARNSADYDLALALFDDDSVIINVVGARFTGRAKIKEFLRSVDGRARSYEIDGVRAGSDVVTWTEAITSQDYEKLGVAPVQVAKEAVIRDGKIKSLVTHFPPSSLAKFEKACEQEGCETPKAEGVLFFGQPCLKFLRNAWTQTRSVTTQ